MTKYIKNTILGVCFSDISGMQWSIFFGLLSLVHLRKDELVKYRSRSDRVVFTYFIWTSCLWRLLSRCIVMTLQKDCLWLMVSCRISFFYAFMLLTRREEGHLTRKSTATIIPESLLLGTVLTLTNLTGVIPETLCQLNESQACVITCRIVQIVRNTDF